MEDNLPLPLDAIHIHHIRNAAESIQQAEDGGVVSKRKNDALLPFTP